MGGVRGADHVTVDKSSRMDCEVYSAQIQPHAAKLMDDDDPKATREFLKAKK